MTVLERITEDEPFMIDNYKQRRLQVVTRIVIMVILLLFVVLMSACNANSDDKVIEELHEFYQGEYDEEVACNGFARSIGLRKAVKGTKDRECPIDEGFIEKYASKYSITELLLCLYSLDCIIPDNEKLESFTNAYGLILKSELLGNEGRFDLSLHGDEGYYGKKKDYTEEEEHTGKFNRTSDASIYMKSYTVCKDWEFYGDWATSHAYGEEYDPGEYGWFNGTFIDRPPSIKQFNDSELELFYKGAKIGSFKPSELKSKNYTLIQVTDLESNWNRRSWGDVEFKKGLYVVIWDNKGVEDIVEVSN